MRLVLPIILLAVILESACAKPSAEVAGPTYGTFVGAGRDRLCLSKRADGTKGGVITYGAGDVNCSASGKVEASGTGWNLTPNGEGGCKIGLTINGDSARVTNVPASCAYYCAPGATLAGKQFTRDSKAGAATDLGGDPLC